MSYRVSIKVDGATELGQRLRRFGVAILDLHTGLGKSGDYLNSFFSGEVFASRGRVIGTPWPALDPRYAAWKAKKFPGRIPLIRTGLMIRSFKKNVGRLSVEMYNEAFYFRFHQEGEGVPQRVMMGVDNRRLERVGNLISEDIADQMTGVGL